MKTGVPFTAVTVGDTRVLRQLTRYWLSEPPRSGINNRMAGYERFPANWAVELIANGLRTQGGRSRVLVLFPVRASGVRFMDFPNRVESEPLTHTDAMDKGVT